MNKTTVWMIFGFLLLLASCKQQQDTGVSKQEEEKEDIEAKAMLQGIWLDDESEEVVFRVEGDTIYYPDPTNQPARFRIVGDSLELNQHRYPIVKQTENLFYFCNQNGDVTKLMKSASDEDTLSFAHKQPEILTITDVLKTDSVVYFNGERYHWYIAVNPTKYRVVRTSYNDEGVAVENVYYDNIIHISIYNGAKCLYSRDFKKQMYADDVPESFLEQAILGNMQYNYTDSKGVHFNATLCIPDEASCYMVETLIDFKGQMTTKLLDS